MTTMEWLNKQKAKIKNAAELSIKIAAFETHRQQANRIFVQGKNAKDAPIGKYNDTKEIYVNPQNSPKKFPALGKPKDGKKKGSSYKIVSIDMDSGTERLRFKRDTRWFSSYRAYRQFIGRPVDTVNLDLFGFLRSDFISGFSGEGTSYQSTIKNPLNQKKIRFQEKHFKSEIFTTSEKEKELFKKISAEEFNKIMAKP